MNRLDQIQRAAFVSAVLVTLAMLATLAAVNASAAGDSVDAIEARVRQIYFEGYPVTASGPLDSVAVERLGEMLRDRAEEPYWSNIVLALGASENAGAYQHLADFAASRPTGEASSGVYQAWVALPVALGYLAHSHPPAFGLIEQMARDVGTDPGWRFESLEGASLASSLRLSAITGLAVSGSPRAASVLSDLEARAGQRGAMTAAESDELLQHIGFARSLHERVKSHGAASALERKPVAQ